MRAMGPLGLICLLGVGAGCAGNTDSTEDTSKEGGDSSTPDPDPDPDGDGFTADNGDCAPNDPSIHPEAVELCDGVDNNCDGVVDGAESEDAQSWYIDEDGDGIGGGEEAFFGCDPGSGYSAFSGDCQDQDAASYPGAEDICDGEDNDCDGAIDEDVKAGWSLITVDSAHSKVVEIDATTAATSEIAVLDVPGMSLNTMDVRGDGLSVVQDANGKALYQMDACTGELSMIGYTGAGNLCGISFGPGGDLYGLDKDTDELVNLNLTAGYATPIGSLGFDLGNCGLAYDCSTDTLYGADADTNTLHTLNPLTGETLSTVQTSVPFVSVGLEFSIQEQKLYASTGTGLYTIDPKTGETQSVGYLSDAYADDLAYHPSCGP